MKVALGGIFTESNQFSENPIKLKEFERGGVFLGDEFYKAKVPSLNGCIDGLREENCEILPLIYASASPGGKVTFDAFDFLYQELKSRLQKHSEVDGLILNMHGAAVLQDGTHLDSLVTNKIRKELKGKYLFITVDLHAYISESLVRSCDAILAWNTYPHSDMYQIGKKAANLLCKTIRKEIIPKMVFSGVNVITSAINASTVGSGPFAKLMSEQLEIESAQKDVISSSLFLCQPYLDQPQMLSGSLMIVDNDLQKAKSLSYEFAEKYWRSRWEFLSKTSSAAKILNEAKQEEFDHFVLIEASDCCGGGAIGDSVHTIKQLIQLNKNQKSLSIVIDPLAIRVLESKNIGNNVKLKIGHQVDFRWGTPVEENFEIVEKSNGEFMYLGGIWGGETGDMGQSYLLKKDKNYILVNSNSTYEWAGEQYSSMNLNLNEFKFILIKNPMNYKNLELSGSVKYCRIDEPGPTPIEVEKLHFQINQSFFPKQRKEEMVVHQIY
jgi:microcystin degradation protein MlrC